MPGYIEVALSGPLKRTFTYRLPDSIDPLTPGQRIIVPFGRSNKVGFYLNETNPPPGITIKPIIKILDQHSYFPTELFNLCRWMADYYFANPADCLTAALPPHFKKQVAASYFFGETLSVTNQKLNGLFKKGKKISPSELKKIKAIKNVSFESLLSEGVIEERWSETTTSTRQLKGYRVIDQMRWQTFFNGKKFQPARFDGLKTRSELLADGWNTYQFQQAIKNNILEPLYEDSPAQLLDFIKARDNIKDLALTDEQKKVVNSMNKRLHDKFSVNLLHGVTGSGKTLVYCHLCQSVLDHNKSILILTPEIALTSTTLAYFRGFFGDDVTVIHSAMTDKERLNSFNGIRTGRYRIVVGPRSALFAPLKNLGLIIVDEEHDSSYKQDDPAPRFQGRDCAIMRAKLNDIPVLLGSASPSIESYHNAKTGRYNLLELTERPGQATLPQVNLVDMKTDRIVGDTMHMSYQLKKAIDKRFDKNEQVILFLNRRGYSPQLRCAECGHVPGCPNCQVKLTYHKKGTKLSCHYCGHLADRYDSCEKCGTHELLYPGAGTQKIEEQLKTIFPKANPIRMDSDTADGRKKAYDILTSFSDQKYNLLLGTQMVTKGLDLPNVTLVGVLAADMALDMPDFRASEKAFARLLQVAGRSGRADRPGEVLIQTFNPDNGTIIAAANQTYQSFYENEIHDREQLNYPPFSRLINITISSKNEQQLIDITNEFKNSLRSRLNAAKISYNLLGPAPCSFYFLRGLYRRHLFLKTNQIQKIVRLLSQWELDEPKFKLPATAKISIDIDPDDML